MTPRLRPLFVMLGIAACLMIFACNNSAKYVTKENLAKIKPGKIKPGMTKAEVEAFMGRGTDDAEALGLSEGSTGAGAAGIGGDLDSVSKPRSATKWLKWGDKDKHIRVGFDDGKVSAGKIESKGL